jgi:hypothetical protein
MALTPLNQRLQLPSIENPLAHFLPTTSLGQGAPLGSTLGNLNTVLQGNIAQAAHHRIQNMLQPPQHMPNMRQMGGNATEQDQQARQFPVPSRGMPLLALGEKKTPKRKIDYGAILKNNRPLPGSSDIDQEIQAVRAELKDKNIPATERRALQSRISSLRNAQIKQTHNDEKIAGSYVNQLSTLNEANQKSDSRLNRMEQLVKRGKLPPANFYKIIKNIQDVSIPAYAGTAAPIAAGIGGGLGFAAGGPAGAALGGALGSGIGGLVGGVIQPVATLIDYASRGVYPDTEEFEKLSTDFISDAKAIFGNRITDQDLRAFMARIPTLSQTDGGKLAVIRNMRLFNKADKVKYETMQELIKANKGRIPANIQRLVEIAAKPDLDAIAQQFESVEE